MIPPASVVSFFTDAFGALPPLRVDTPLHALGYEPIDAVVLAHMAQQLNPPVHVTDVQVVNMHTVGDWAAILMSDLNVHGRTD